MQICKPAKKSIVNTLSTLALAALLTQGFAGCGSDSDGGTTNPTPSTSTGVFLDCEVTGLTYQSGNNPPGTTDDNGTFTYTPGEPLTFSVGGVQLGTLTDGAAICTPNDFVIPENIARFLQSIDGDGIPSNGIDVTVAAADLANQNVPSSVFENPTSGGFAGDTAITNALALTGDTLIDPTIALNNLAAGTDSIFDPAELAGKSFASSSPLDAGLGVITFDSLVNVGDQGSTGSDIVFEDATDNGGSGFDEDFTWVINATGTLTLTFEDGSVATVTKAGSSARAITGVVTEAGEAPSVVTLLKPLTVTETLLCGAPVTPNGTSTKSYNVSTSQGVVSITFKSDGTQFGIDPIDGPISGFWSVSQATPNVIIIIDGMNPDQIPADWTLLMLLDGSLATSGQLFAADVTFNGFNALSGFNFTWNGFEFITITPGIPFAN